MATSTMSMTSTLTLLPLPSSITSTSTSTSTPTSSSLLLPSPTSILDGPNVDDNNCVLLGPFALFIQAFMGILVILTLVYKRHREVPKRPWKIWTLDISKQMLGQAFVHTLNVLLSDLIARNDKENPCALYFLNIAVDTTVGVLIIYLILRLATHILTDVYHLSGFVSGEYFDPAPPVEIRRRRENERKRNRKNLKIRRKGFGRRAGSVTSTGSTQSQPLPSTSNFNPNLDFEESQTATITTSESNPHPSTSSGIKRNGKPALKNSASHPGRASSDSFYGPLSPSSTNHTLSDSIPPGLPPPNSSRSNSNTNSTARSQRPRLGYWSRQLLIYLLALLLMKIAVLLIFLIFPFLFTIGKWLLGLFGKHRRAQVVFAMAIFPLIMNILQFWLIDTLLRHNPTTSSYSKLISEDLDERDGLMNYGDGGRGIDDQARESGEFDYEDDEDDEEEDSSGTRSKNRSRDSSEGNVDQDEEDGWGWSESSRRSLEGLGNQARKGIKALKDRLNPNSTSIREHDHGHHRPSSSSRGTGGSSSSRKSNRKGVPQSLRFSDHPSFSNESQTHLVGEASDGDEEVEERGRDPSSHNPNLHYPPSLDSSPLSSPSSANAKLGADRDSGRVTSVEGPASFGKANPRDQGESSVSKDKKSS